MEQVGFSNRCFTAQAGRQDRPDCFPERIHLKDGVERATGPFWRATRPPEDGFSDQTNQFGDSGVRGSRRQVAAEDSQVGCSTRNPSPLPFPPISAFQLSAFQLLV